MLTKIPKIIDPINEWVANLGKWLILVLALLNFYEVFMRYVFDRPSMWVYDVSYMVGGAFFSLGMGYTLLKKKHVRVDVIYVKLKKKTQAFLDIILTLLIFFPTFGMLMYKLIPWVITSWERKEKASGSFWLPPIYPLKTIMLIAIILLILQAISELMKDIHSFIVAKEEGAE